MENISEQLSFKLQPIISRGYIDYWGENVRILFEGEVDDDQKNSLAFLLEHADRLYPELETALYNYYLESMAVYREALEEFADQFMPHLKKPSDVWSYINRVSKSAIQRHRGFRCSTCPLPKVLRFQCLMNR